MSSHFSSTPLNWRVPAQSEVLESQGASIHAIADSDYSLFDIDGDGRPDLVFTSVRLGSGHITETTPGAGTANPHWNVHLNTGSGFSTKPIPWPVRSESYHPPSFSKGQAHWATFDIDGDGKVDFVETSDPDALDSPWGASGPTPHWKVYLGTGTGFSSTPLNWRVPAQSEVLESQGASIHAIADSDYSLFDIDGDGRPDLVFTSVRLGSGHITETTPGAGTANPHWNVHLNTGSGFSTKPIPWPVRSESYHPPSFSKGQAHWATFDIDGDGKVDFVETSDPDALDSPWGASGPTPHWKVYLGTP
ncbi:MAG: hypothetical protein BWY17_04354 [Deltaproteobacteria bacterium ADurb.Bin207]|nr:MAG: hypothetical protein BWY17_04354 [Deltaproteobacteria bacterium ADurb.Bin207]